MILYIFIALCWGSFLNVIAYRLVHQVNFWRMRSFCPSCNQTIAWYDNIPLLSWILLRGKCRTCHAAISILYPFVEAITAILLPLLAATVAPAYFLAYFTLFSALIITIRTDLETMLISRFVTFALIPAGIISSWLGLLPISVLESVMGAIFGYAILWLIATIYFLFTKKRGMGQGDMELLALIGSFTGPLGCWITLLLGSIMGSIIGIIVLIKKGSRMIPFGPFLAYGAIIYVLTGSFFIRILFPLLVR